MKLSEPSKRRELGSLITIRCAATPVYWDAKPVLGFDKPDGLRKVDRELFFATPASMSVGACFSNAQEQATLLRETDVSGSVRTTHAVESLTNPEQPGPSLHQSLLTISNGACTTKRWHLPPRLQLQPVVIYISSPCSSTLPFAIVGATRRLRPNKIRLRASFLSTWNSHYYYMPLSLASRRTCVNMLHSPGISSERLVQARTVKTCNPHAAWQRYGTYSVALKSIALICTNVLPSEDVCTYEQYLDHLVNLLDKVWTLLPLVLNCVSVFDTMLLSIVDEFVSAVHVDRINISPMVSVTTPIKWPHNVLARYRVARKKFVGAQAAIAFPVVMLTAV
ncbi:hypothetical protein GQ600_2538 [Phytophthora cactorum]|nr:hypothetical protein GQ600_2538 [Phytophthora cactorum]